MAFQGSPADERPGAVGWASCCSAGAHCSSTVFAAAVPMASTATACSQPRAGDQRPRQQRPVAVAAAGGVANIAAASWAHISPCSACWTAIAGVFYPKRLVAIRIISSARFSAITGGAIVSPYAAPAGPPQQPDLAAVSSAVFPWRRSSTPHTHEAAANSSDLPPNLFTIPSSRPQTTD